MNPANNSQDINFIPQEIVERRVEIKTRAANNKFSIGVSLVALAITGTAFYYNYNLQSQIKTIDAEITASQAKVDSLQEFGKHGYKLGLRLQNAKTIVNNRANYSYVLDELRARTPSTVIVSNYAVSGGGISLDATTKFGYPTIADFQESLIAQVNEIDRKNLFSDVRLLNADFNKADGTVSFSLQFNLTDEIKKEQN
jgi:Tfp pilus assembly protein PilN